MRIDGRAPNEARPLKITTNYLATAEGSTLIEVGHTRVLCAATIEDSVPPFLRNSGKGWITAEYAMLPRATATRTQREVSKGKPSGRTHEIQRLIGRSLRSIVDLNALGERSIIIDCDVIQADGGTRTASITGAYIALATAIQTLIQFKFLAKNPLIDSIAATSVGLVGNVPLLDLCYEEDSRAEVDMNVVMTGSGSLSKFRLPPKELRSMILQMIELLALARNGIQHLLAAQNDALSTAAQK